MKCPLYVRVILYIDTSADTVTAVYKQVWALAMYKIIVRIGIDLHVFPCFEFLHRSVITEQDVIRSLSKHAASRKPESTDHPLHVIFLTRY